ncbi:Leucine rich repeat [Popillia japonica]|uniref:Leucine rich repeat n=1 Tax=Popillia japonica TaxID=7064 RepID=A0AAW1JVF7_POPJA
MLGLLSLLIVFLLEEVASGCPTDCICKWKNGKQTVECINKDMLVIPDGMDMGTQVLEFSGNNLHSIHKEKFLKMDLINLQRIYLSRCRIAIIDGMAFKGLANLVELDLSGNMLETVPTEIFIDTQSLMRLTLSYNPIKSVKRLAFNHLSFLNTLELDSCEIRRIEEGAFIGLHSLEWLHLKNNKMTSVNGSQVFPSTLRGVELQGNLWECDCHMLEMHTWLRGFSIPLTSEPKCKRPPKLAGRPIKSIPTLDLACLPDVSPTTFYLEIGEGKNVSLLCHVHAVPEAHVSWWFQGQLLQNDSLVAPGMRLIYFIEEGSVNKRSELFIYNTNTEDNGTFICTAENSAGIVYSNFTIRVILREEPQFEITTLHFEFILITVSAAAVSLLVLIIVLILSLVRCYKNSRRRRKREMNKLHDTKDSLLLDSIEEFSEQSQHNNKQCSNITLVDRQEMFYNVTHPNEDLLGTMSTTTISTSNQVKTPTTLRRYQLEQNPDLINDTESVVAAGRRKEGDGESHVNFEEAIENFKLSSSSNLVASNVLPSNVLPSNVLAPNVMAPNVMAPNMLDGLRRSARDLYRLSADVHLNPVGLLNTGDCYRTLPYNRGGGAGKRQSSNPINRIPREAEFIARGHQAQPAYEHYCADVRYTADGYPVRTVAEQETTFSEGSVHSCCSLPPIQWPSCVPAVVVRMNSNAEDKTVTTATAAAAKKCVGAQTQTESDDLKISAQKTVSLCNVAGEVDTGECPDEGYEGETMDPC